MLPTNFNVDTVLEAMVSDQGAALLTRCSGVVERIGVLLLPTLRD